MSNTCPAHRSPLLLTMACLSLTCLTLTGCVSTQFALVEPGPVPLQSFAVSVSDAGWNRAPGTMTGHLHPGSQMWTRDGVLLDQLLLLDGINNGQALFKSNSNSIVYPLYQNGMLPNEILELTVSSLTTSYGTGAVVEPGGLSPVMLGDQRAAMFDFYVSATEQPRRQGRAVTFVAGDRLYLLIFQAADIHYFDKHWQAALSVMQSATPQRG